MANMRNGNYGTNQSPDGPLDQGNIATLQRLEDIKSQSLDHELWAAAQSLALAKLKVFHTMAKTVNEQAGQ
jgi:hypothetical protein